VIFKDEFLGMRDYGVWGLRNSSALDKLISNSLPIFLKFLTKKPPTIK
jgi:hypothetical protein